MNEHELIKKLENENKQLHELVNQLSSESERLSTESQRPVFLNLDGFRIRADAIQTVVSYSGGSQINGSVQTLALPEEVLKLLNANEVVFEAPAERRPKEDDRVFLVDRPPGLGVGIYDRELLRREFPNFEIKE